MTAPQSDAEGRGPWEELLGTEGSLIAAVAAAGLDGLRGILRAALAAAPLDEGAVACAALLTELDRLPDLTFPARTARQVPSGMASTLPPMPAQPPPAPVTGIAALARELATSAQAEDFAAGAALPGDDTDADGPRADKDRVRRWFHLTLLRLPERYAAPWRRRAAEVDRPGEGPWRTLRGWADEELLPPSADGRPGIRTARESSVELRDLAELVLALGEYDEALCHLLDRLWTGGSSQLVTDEVRRAYRGELSRRLELMERSAQDSTERLRACVSADEAVCSVTHLPPGAPGSWWQRLAEESHGVALDLCREMRATGRNVEAVLPARPYREARGHTQGDDVRLGAGGRPGDTLTCLRLWLRVDDQVFPGRVVYRGKE
ncbi:hypothetical protein ACQEVG_14250 [Streptomyces sp. CA-135486]|uniref:hypothetical protein n=1 Tax=Streptomyces sp. CA-135486 TaxID=3240049 RepID=UPI003D8C55AA